jgi:hypothetical protein
MTCSAGPGERPAPSRWHHPIGPLPYVKTGGYDWELFVTSVFYLCTGCAVVWVVMVVLFNFPPNPFY